MFKLENSVIRRFCIALSRLKVQALVLLFGSMFATAGWAQSVALDFDGQNDYVTLSSLPQQWSDLLDNGFSITLQAQPKSYGSPQRLFFIQQDSANFATAMVNYLGVVYFYMQRDGISYSRSSQSALERNTWHNLAFRWEPGDSGVTIWTDGQNTTNPATSGTTSWGNNATFTLGARTDGRQVFNGVLDNVRIWGSALDAVSIGNIANNYCLGPSSPLHVYDFEVGTAGADNAGLNTLPDLIGSNPGSLSGFSLVGTRSNWVTGQPDCADYDFSLSSTVSHSVVAPADQLTWSATVDGNTLVPGDALPNVEMTFSLPANLQFISVTADPIFSCTTPTVGSSGSVLCTASGLVDTASHTLAVTTRVDPAVAPNTVLETEWNLLQPQSDRLPTNNRSMASVRVSNTLLLVDDDVTLNGSSIDINVLANDADSPGGPGLDPASLVLSYPAENGTAGCDSNGCSYLRDSGFSGTDSFRYQVCDAGTPQVCDEATVRIEALSVAGACGTADGVVTLAAPSSNLCSVGTASAVDGSATAFTWTCLGQYGGADSGQCSAPRQYEVTPSAGANGSIAPSSMQLVTAGQTASFAVTPPANYSAVISGTCPAGSWSGSSYTTGAIMASCTVTASFAARTAIAIPLAEGPHSGDTLDLAVTGSEWHIDAAQSLTVASLATALPPGVTLPHGAVSLRLTDGTPGSNATVELTYPFDLPAGTRYYKYGPTADNPADHWYAYPGAVISGNTITLTLTDGGAGDSDLNVNGIIDDPGGPALLAADLAPIPTLSQWVIMLLAGIIGMLALKQVQRVENT
ncbi:Concanavalin A-like lectin/glucanases superfamily protein [Halopseudomonas salegens]|uniref:Concanavalin A-like lectin/glucanases superfamily protein n=2 Tax=Halopseudomonas salegens TaxID=1434072 RepID=A0A1H2F4M8_9GAMM|nr:Concanavalin A-like lectin/glucanases superfamily protein [Halopseudomonas salegens]